MRWGLLRRRTRSIRLLALAMVGVLGLLLGCVPAKPKPTLLIYGDSLTVLAEPAITYLYSSKYNVVFRAAGGTAMCDWAPYAAADRIIYKPAQVVLAFTGNVDDCVDADFQRSQLAGVVSNYELNLRLFAQSYAGLPIKVVAPPAMNNTSPTYAGWFPYNGNPALLAMYAQVCAQLGLTYSAAADDGLTPGHVYTAMRPAYGTKAPLVTVRTTDGIHLTPAGTIYYAHALADSAPSS
jgi:hypothetical protein